MKVRLVHFLSFFLLLGVVSSGLAIERVREEPFVLEQGMHFNEVVQRWGAPLAKEEFEVLREEQWRFRRHVVRFREGVLVSVERLEEPGQQVSLGEGEDRLGEQERGGQSIEVEALAAELGLDRGEEIEIGDILSEIMQSSSESADSAPSIPAKEMPNMAVMPRHLAEVIVDGDEEEEY